MKGQSDKIRPMTAAARVQFTKNDMSNYFLECVDDKSGKYEKYFAREDAQAREILCEHIVTDFQNTKPDVDTFVAEKQTDDSQTTKSGTVAINHGQAIFRLPSTLKTKLSDRRIELIRKEFESVGLSSDEAPLHHEGDGEVRRPMTACRNRRLSKAEENLQRLKKEREERIEKNRERFNAVLQRKRENVAKHPERPDTAIPGFTASSDKTFPASRKYGQSKESGWSAAYSKFANKK
ncbi:hypothetical protein SNEBB_006821 [Seison nebaliae]|nr:hypothetical protein SNEBB_006821 [Seison nebaliae]